MLTANAQQDKTTHMCVNEEIHSRPILRGPIRDTEHQRYGATSTRAPQIRQSQTSANEKLSTNTSYTSVCGYADRYLLMYLRIDMRAYGDERVFNVTARAHGGRDISVDFTALITWAME